MIIKKSAVGALVIFTSVFATVAIAQEEKPMSTERPSKTDSPYTVTAGRYQIETNVLGYTYDKDCLQSDCTRNKTVEVFGTNNLRIGFKNK